ncbi:MAG TPA: nuclear transport factor 2 family protein [Kineosporiaceae bacterium]|nr:nuclear transport factor 2 family protein [Kineosporiaceae bacterium]
MTDTNTLAIASHYVDAVNAKDFGAMAGLFAEDIVWHQPGSNRHSGIHRGSAAVGQLIGAQMAFTNGTLEIAVAGAPMVNGDVFALPVHFSAKREGAELSMDGVDIMKVDGDKIVEMWLFSAVEKDEDAFWDAD